MVNEAAGGHGLQSLWYRYYREIPMLKAKILLVDDVKRQVLAGARVGGGGWFHQVCLHAGPGAVSYGVYRMNQPAGLAREWKHDRR